MPTTPRLSPSTIQTLVTIRCGNTGSRRYTQCGLASGSVVVGCSSAVGSCALSGTCAIAVPPSNPTPAASARAQQNLPLLAMPFPPPSRPAVGRLNYAATAGALSLVLLIRRSHLGQAGSDTLPRRCGAQAPSNRLGAGRD